MTNILDLPCAVRRQVYVAAGVVTGRTINMSALVRVQHPDWYEETYYEGRVPRLRTALALLLVCRAINLDVNRLFYSSNTFCINRKEPNDLLPLRSLSPTAVQSMRSLSIQLNAASCGPSWCQQAGTNGDKERVTPDEPLTLKSARGRDVLREWGLTVDALRPHIRSGRLKLYLVCDVADRCTAGAVVAVLLRLPALAACQLRLARHPHAELQQLARAYALRATGQLPTVAPRNADHFRVQFGDLPKEIRLRILEYTDLVAPRNEVEWNPMDGWYLLDRARGCPGNVMPEPAGRGCDVDRHHGCQFRPCLKYKSRVGCFCGRWHSAYGTESSRCRCWEPPTNLFLVSRAFRLEAQEIFLKCNRIIVMNPPLRREARFPNPSWPHDVLETPCYPRTEFDFLFGNNQKHQGTPPPADRSSRLPYRYPVSIFLTKTITPASSLRHLRNLDLCFPPIASPSSARGPWSDDWRKAVQFAGENLNLAILTLRVYFEDYSAIQLVPLCRRPSRMTEEGRDGLLAAYNYVCEPVRVWAEGKRDGRLAKLFVRLADHEIGFTPPSTILPLILHRRWERERRINEQAEKMVMGPL